MNKILLSSNRDDWETPQDLFDALHRVFGFVFDVCANDSNKKCDGFFSKSTNALTSEWKDSPCWMNPPYGRNIGNWVKKAYESSINHRTTVVCLLPARTDTRWWHDFCTKGEIFYLKGRLKFSESKNSATFPSAIVVFRPSVKYALDGKFDFFN